MANILITISSILALVSYVVYAIAILKGQAKPHRTTRFVILLITIIATTSLLVQGSTTAVWLIGAMMVGSLFVFLLTLKYGMGGWAKTDIVCLIIALLGIAIWRTTSNPMYAFLASVGADMVGQIPMLIKTYKFPQTEVWTFYFIDVVAAILSLLAISHWSVLEVVYPLYIVTIDGLTILLILRLKILAPLKIAS